MTTIYFSSPLLVAVLAMPVLKERVPWSRWASLVVGFAGVVIACRPAALLRADLAQTGPGLLVLAAAMLWAYSTIRIRQTVHAGPPPVVCPLCHPTLVAV